MADANAPSKKKGGIKVGQYVWVKDAAIAGDNLYVKGLVKNIDDKGKVTVECYNESKSEELELPKDECYPPHPGEDVPDHCQLMFLSQATLLENTRVRFANDHIHTYVGDILVVVNPFKWDVQQAGHPVYSDAVKAMCVDKKLQTAGCGPHVFAMAEKAYVQLKTSVKKVGRLQSQCVVVSALQFASRVPIPTDTFRSRRILEGASAQGTQPCWLHGGRSSWRLGARCPGTMLSVCCETLMYQLQLLTCADSIW